MLLTQQAVLQSGVVLLLQHLILLIKAETVLLGQTHSLRIMQSSVLGMFLANARIRARLAEDALALKDSAVAEEVKAYLDTFEDTRANDAPAKALIAALEKADLSGDEKAAAEDFPRIRIMLLRRASGSSAATAGLMISVSAVLIMFLLRIRM